MGYTVLDVGNVVIPQPESQPVGNSRVKYLEPIVQVAGELSALVTAALEAGEFPLILGGDHSIALGSISGVARVHKDVSVIWVDAHGDFNTEETTPSGNIHGMVLAALAGLGQSQLVNFGGWTPKIDASKLVIVGARALDPGEQALLRKHHIHVFTMSEIDEQGMHRVMQQALEITNDSPIHLSLDLDALDPQEAPGVGTPVRGGLSYREAHLVMEHICDSGRLVSMDVVEVNPLLDHKNETALLAVELIRSALGKKIL
jgi:arginase